MTFATILGLGLIGGSIGAALRARGVRVTGYDSNTEHAWIARDSGLVDVVASDLEDAMAYAELVILSMPVRAVIKLLPEIDNLALPAALLIDTGSTKAKIVATMGQLPGSGRCVGGHPLVGRERSGPRGSSAELLSDGIFALCPSTETNEPALARAELLVRQLKMRAVVIDANSHDAILARTSHVPQLLATAFALSLLPVDATLAGPAARGLLRLARSDVTMWQDIAFTNREQIGDCLAAFDRQLHELRGIVAAGDEERFSRVWREAQRAALEVAG